MSISTELWGSNVKPTSQHWCTMRSVLENATTTKSLLSAAFVTLTSSGNPAKATLHDQPSKHTSHRLPSKPQGAPPLFPFLPQSRPCKAYQAANGSVEVRAGSLLQVMLSYLCTQSGKIPVQFGQPGLAVHQSLALWEQPWKSRSTPLGARPFRVLLTISTSAPCTSCT